MSRGTQDTFLVKSVMFRNEMLGLVAEFPIDHSGIDHTDRNSGLKVLKNQAACIERLGNLFGDSLGKSSVTNHGKFKRVNIDGSGTGIQTSLWLGIYRPQIDREKNQAANKTGYPYAFSFHNPNPR